MLKFALASTVLFLVAAGPLQAQTVSAALKTADGKPAGAISLTDAPSGVLLHIEAQGLTPGWHALHFHEKGDCADPKLTNAGAHINMTDPKHAHGFMAQGGPDFGDLTNLYVAADGTGKAEVFSAQVSLKGTGGRPALLDADGSALIVHALPDDYTTQPIGGAGARVACAVIR